MSIVAEKCFKKLMDYYRNIGDKEQQLKLFNMTEKDILLEHLSVFGLEGGIYE